MPRGIPIGSKEADQALRLVAEGKTLSEIATIVGVSYGGLHRALTDAWPDEYAEAKQRRDDVIRNKVWTLGVVQPDDAATTRWALDHLIKWHLPESRETHRVEVTGGVKLTHERGLTLADMLNAARSVPGLDGGAIGELPAARPVLAELDEGEPAASDLPVRPAP